MKILCVDDDQVARTIYIKGLGKRLPDDEIFVVTTGEEALELMEKEPMNIVVTDLMLPGISGIDLLMRSKRLDLRCEMIVVTGRASIDSAVEAMRNGARDYLEKPISVPLLLEKINNIRDYHQRANEAEEYRLAKEDIEQHAAHELHLLEHRFQEMRTAVNSALGKIGSFRTWLKSPEAVLAGTESERDHCTEYLEEITSILQPFDWKK